MAMIEDENRKQTVVALGMFDGVHIGHKKLIDTAVMIAKSRGLVPGVFTFSNHPQQLLGADIRRLSTNDERARLMRALGVEYVTEIPFTSEICSKSPEQFLMMLIEKIDPCVIVAGYNYTFGRKKQGNSDVLQRLAAARGIDSAIIPPVLLGKEAVSSTRIRNMLEKGDVKNVQVLLGRTYSLTGTVYKNKQLGRGMGFPTANILPETGLVIPADGVYVTFAEVMGNVYPAVTNIGSNPTVGGNRTTIETNILDFDADVYGQELTVRFVKRLRPVIKFSSIEELRAQIQKDTLAARSYFGITGQDTNGFR